MPRSIKPPKSIAEQGGLKPYLEKTREQHKGLGYAEFLRYISPLRKHPVPKPVIAEEFDVTPATIYNWIRIHEAERKATRQQGAQSGPAAPAQDSTGDST